MPKALAILFAFLLLTASCQDEDVFEHTPTERARQHARRLYRQLTEAPHGWLVTYFPKTDSLLFTQPGAHIGEYDFNDEDYGYGGHNFLMSFTPEGFMEMLGDDNEQTLSTPKKGEFEVGQNSSTQISFTTYNYIHRLVNENWNGSSDFLYVRTDLEGRLWFRTTSYLDVAKEYIVFRKIESREERDTVLSNAFKNRKLFEEMKNPVLTIRQGHKIFFRSNYNIQHIRGKIARRNRFHLFLFNKTPNPTGRYPLEMNGLASGYVGTEKGLSFETGFRYNKNHIFHDFVREGTRFVCELVKIYDPLERKEKWVSRHLYPQGQTTGIIAEITEENQ